MTKAFYCISLYILTFLHFCKSLRNEKLHFGKWLPDQNQGFDNYVTFDWKTVVGISECVYACKLSASCCYINFKVRSQLCALLRPSQAHDKQLGSVETFIRRKPGYIFGAKSEWNVGLDLCESCLWYGTDDNNDGEENTVPCGDSGCYIPHGTSVKGNMFSNGDRILQQCEYVNSSMQVAVDFRQTECTENGTWSYDKDCLGYFGNSRYHVEDSVKLTWQEAQAMCEELSGHLLNIETEQEQKFMETMIAERSSSLRWSGGRDTLGDNVCKWTDGSLIQDGYQNWNRIDHEMGDCVRIRGNFRKKPFEWTLGECTDLRYSICELPLVNRTID